MAILRLAFTQKFIYLLRKNGITNPFERDQTEVDLYTE